MDLGSSCREHGIRGRAIPKVSQLTRRLVEFSENGTDDRNTSRGDKEISFFVSLVFIVCLFRSHSMKLI